MAMDKDIPFALMLYDHAKYKTIELFLAELEGKSETSTEREFWSSISEGKWGSCLVILNTVDNEHTIHHAFGQIVPPYCQKRRRTPISCASMSRRCVEICSTLWRETRRTRAGWLLPVNWRKWHTDEKMSRVCSNLSCNSIGMLI